MSQWSCRRRRSDDGTCCVDLWILQDDDDDPSPIPGTLPQNFADGDDDSGRPDDGHHCHHHHHGGGGGGVVDSSGRNEDDSSWTTTTNECCGCRRHVHHGAGSIVSVEIGGPTTECDDRRHDHDHHYDVDDSSDDCDLDTGDDNETNEVALTLTDARNDHDGRSDVGMTPFRSAEIAAVVVAFVVTKREVVVLDYP